MNISAHFIRRPVATTLITAGIVMAGVIALRALPVSPLPHVEFPTIAVSAALPGAEPETMASSVAAPLERQFGLISGIAEITSSSTLGATGIVLQFDLGRDIDGAARDVQAAINAARSYLPPNLPGNPTYRKVNPAEAPVLIIALTSDTVTTAKIYDAASSILQQKLSQVAGVGQVIVGGGSLPAVRVEMKPLPLNRYGISLEAVRAVLAATNVNRPKGQFSDATRTWEIETNDQLYRAADYSPVYVAYNAAGLGVKLTDVASVQDSVEDVRTAGLVNGRPAVMVIVFRQPTANIIGTVDRVRALLPRLAGSLPGGVDLSIVLDRTPPIRGSLKDVEITLVLSALLVILVVFAFLRNVRSTAIPAVAVAVSLVGTFGVMYLCGYSLDNLSLMALTIATGFVVDDAIVVLENITRHIEHGVSPLEAAFTGAREITFTVVSMSTSLVAVFIPILLMGGMVGRLFREFAVTLSAAVTVSLVVSLTTTPMMCARLLRPERGTRRGAIYRLSERLFNGMHALYDKSLGWSLRHASIMLVPTIIAVALSAYLFSIIPKGFFPEQDTGRLLGIIQADQDISFQSMEKKLGQVVDVIRADPDVDAVAAFTGAASGSPVNTARMFVALKGFSERKTTAEQIIARLRGRLLTISGAPTYLQPVQDLRVGARLSAALYQYTLQGQDVPELNRWSTRVLERARTIPQLRDVSSDQQDKGLQASVAIDRATASRFGITSQLVDNTLYDAFGQRQVSILYTLLNQYHLVMEVEPQFWQHPETLRDIYLPSAALAGAMVPLGAVTTFQRTNTALAVNHQGQFPAVTISFNLGPGVSLGEAVSAVDSATRQMGLPASIQGSFQGTAEAFLASLANEPLLILAALVTVYIVLGVLYESYVHPVTILSTLPSAGVGALLALLFFRADLSVIAVIGIILLIGIVKKNGIMMVDFALDAERREGKAPVEAVYQAALLRFRPIMMTTMAALLGALPLALGRGVGSELRAPLGIAIVGGLIISQLLTLYTTPVIYLYLDRLRLALKSRRPGRAGRRIALFMAIGAAALFSACSVGPDYVRPPVETPAAYKELAGWKRAEPREGLARGAWWQIFGDPELDALEAKVDISNQNIAAAEAQFREALAQVKIARSAYFPTLSAGASLTRSSASTTLGSGPLSSRVTVSDYLLPVQFAWEIDVWGRVRRLVEASAASAQASAADLEAVRLSARALLTQDYFQLRDMDAQKQLLDETVVAYRRTLRITQNQYNHGTASRGDVALAETQLETTVAQAIDVGVLRAQLEHAIASLIGKPASLFSIAPAPLAARVPPIPAGLPSDLLERRPDVAAAERAAAAANAQIGVAVAAFFPTLSLGASGGFESFDLSRWLTWPSRFWSVGPAVSEVVYEGGLRRAQTEQARAAYDASVAAYRQTVLTAFQQVEDNLAALRILEEEARAQDRAVSAAERSLSQALNQYRIGTASYLTVVTAQAALLTNRRTAVDILYRRMASTVLLVQALGGGWSVQDLRPSRKDVPPTSTHERKDLTSLEHSSKN